AAEAPDHRTGAADGRSHPRLANSAKVAGSNPAPPPFALVSWSSVDANVTSEKLTVVRHKRLQLNEAWHCPGESLHSAQRRLVLIGRPVVQIESERSSLHAGQPHRGSAGRCDSALAA